jgi:signal transduction histidine kinase
VVVAEPAAPAGPLDERFLLRTATGRDAALAHDVLGRAGIGVQACVSMAVLVDELARGAGVLMLAEEVLWPADMALLKTALAAQPAWSDVPLLVLARSGADSPAVGRVLAELPNVTIIERPMRVAALVSLARSALRARRRQYEVRALLDGLQLADRRKTEFLATLAHELRNPLAPISSTLALLINGPARSGDPQRHYALMQRHVQHMVRLIDDLMEVSRITRGKVVLERAPMRLQQALADAVEVSRPLLDAARHRLKLVIDDAPLAVDGDRVRLTQVFANLLNNAAKYTPAGGEIVLTARRDDGHAVVSVSDNGAGLEPGMLASAFDMFVQAGGAARQAQGGLGIGLTLVRSLVELHGGTVDATSAGLGRGSTFTVRLPLHGAAQAAGEGAAAPQPDDRRMKAGTVADRAVAGGAERGASSEPVRSLAPARQPTAASAPPPRRVPRRVLIVDDNRDAADSLAELLHVHGAEVRTAYDGESALQLHDRFDAAVLDIGLPGMDGCELARRLRQAPGGAGLRLIALTGWGQEADRRRVAAAGFDHHLLKPVDPALLAELLARQG